MNKNLNEKKILILGADTSTADAITYLKEKGVRTVLTDYNPPERLAEKRMTDEYWMIDVADTDALEKACREEGITNIFAGNHEFCLDQCKELCARLGFPFYASEKGWHASRDKLFYKAKCIEKGLRVPELYPVDASLKEEDLKKINYPVIVKPNDGNGRRGVFLAGNEEELKEAYLNSMKFSGRKEVLVEQFIDGDEIFYICYVYRGELYLVDVVVNRPVIIDGEKKFGFFDHDRLFVRNIDPREFEAYREIVKELECENGLCIFQGIRKDGRVYNMEFGFRLDGFCTWRRTKVMSGVDYLALMVDLALGEYETDCFDEDRSIPDETYVGYVLWGRPGRVAHIEGREELYERDDLIILWDRFGEGDIIPDTPDMRSIAFAIEIFGSSYEEIKEKMKNINKDLHLYDEDHRDLLEYRLPEYEKWKY